VSGPRIYTGAEALALREAAEHPVAPAHTHTLTLTTGETALLHAAPSLAASVAHHEARAERAEAERERLLPRKGEHVNELYACVARVLSRLGVQDHGGDPLEALESYADEEHERSLAETDARNTIAADRDAALAHAAELEAALRVVRSTAEREAADVLALRAERDALRAVIEGRTTPPTDEEVAAHAAAGGGWVLCNPAAPLDTRVVCLSAATARVRADFCRRTVTRRWWALDAEGRPCGWPPTGDSK